MCMYIHIRVYVHMYILPYGIGRLQFIHPCLPCTYQVLYGYPMYYTMNTLFYFLCAHNTALGVLIAHICIIGQEVH